MRYQKNILPAIRIPVTMHWVWSPVGLLLLLPGPALLASLLVNDNQFMEWFGQPRFLSPSLKLIALVNYILLLSISALASRTSPVSRATIDLDEHHQRWLDYSVRCFATITFGAYAIWFILAIVRGLNFVTITALVSGDSGAMYILRNDYFGTVGGVTTWMELGVLLGPLTILRSRAGIRSGSPILVVLFLFALTRAFLNSERLALVEVIVSTLIACLALRQEAPKPLLSKARVLVFFILSWVGLIVAFGAFEYFRSWRSQGLSSGRGFAEFVGTLFFGYYATALNLAAFDNWIMNGQHWLGAMFDGGFYRAIFGVSPTGDAQGIYGFVTFTNRSGLLTPVNALGFVGSAILWSVIGLLIGKLARQASFGGALALAAYCATATGMLEVVRIFYFGSSRFLPIIIGIIALAFSLVFLPSNEANSLRTRRIGGA